MPNTIILRGKGIRKEDAAGGVITPGHLIEKTSTGTVVVHSSAGLNAMKQFAVENDLVGKAITDDYASGDNVLYEVCPPGTEVNALVINGTAAILQAAFLESDGAGGVQTAIADAATDTAQRSAIIGQALEAVDNSGGGAPVRIKIEVM